MMSDIFLFECVVFRPHTIKISFVYVDKAKHLAVKEQLCIPLFNNDIVDVF